MANIENVAAADSTTSSPPPSSSNDENLDEKINAQQEEIEKQVIVDVLVSRIFGF